MSMEETITIDVPEFGRRFFLVKSQSYNEVLKLTQYCIKGTIPIKNQTEIDVFMDNRKRNVYIVQGGKLEEVLERARQQIIEILKEDEARGVKK